MADAYVERKVRLSPRAAEIWDEHFLYDGVTMSAALEAMAELHDAELAGADAIALSALTFTAWADAVNYRAREITQRRRSRRPND